MRKVFLLILSFPFLNGAAFPQNKTDSFFSLVGKYALVKHINFELKIIQNFTDSTWKQSNNKKLTSHTYYSGKFFQDNLNVEFTFLTIELKKYNIKKSTGEILVSGKVSDIDILKKVNFYINRYKIKFDSISILKDSVNQQQKVFLSFANYSPKIMEVMNRFDILTKKLVMHEYFDLYFCDINKKTSTWKIERKYFEPPFSDVLIELVSKKKIKSIFSLIELKNEGFSWNLAEGLWYYNSSNNILTKEQLRIVERYNGGNGMITFRTKEELAKIYKFK